ncbi:hypothetical protein UFOVP699_92 [uncultured Caudovirales phage]|uniref:Uncharacterized protein n=1 Tax=uncultured Caudovirales phage TaxID=2100421 RepID=A0A6J5NVU4_9CAUD|nr:hypothetical protein UFOVP699_92 [uncultured Caudovirales phage]
MKSLYAYYGLIDIHDIDSPGHSLYQIGLIDSISETFGEEKFDFYSYYPEEEIKSANLKGFPDTELGWLFGKYRKSLLDNPIHNIDELLQKISAKEYKRLYLKARFRNLSALSKKWKDAREFEQIIETAFRAGYSKKDIIILDTDLSLSEKVKEKLGKVATFMIPSIDFPGVSNRFLKECQSIHSTKWEKTKTIGSVFYGNIDTSKYKKGNNKSDALLNIVKWINSYHNIVGTENPFYVVCKKNDFTDNFSGSDKNTFHINRNHRELIWGALESSSIMINVTKEKYNEKKFIPARIYEAMIFGMIPVSYKFDFLCPAFSFEKIEDLIEIYKYLFEIEPDEIHQAYEHFVKSYFSYLDKKD